MILSVDSKKLFKSFGFAFSGLKTIFEEEHAFKIMFFIAILVIAAMFYFDLPLTQKAVLFTMIFLVLILELINSVIEKVLDFVCSELNGKVKIIKDVLAGIVLLASLGAAAIGILIFLPYF
ncbi:MAG: diacylglycerol kinase family protein [Patescibacteria group bacterium]